MTGSTAMTDTLFKKYNHIIGDSASMAGNLVLAFAEDDRGRNWIAAGPRVSVLDDKTAVGH